MQICGNLCLLCYQPIVLEREGAACNACNAVAHRTCIATSGEFCPQCQNPWIKKRFNVTLASRCPVCGESNRINRSSICKACGTALGYDSRDDLKQERIRIHLLAFKNLGTCFALILFDIVLLCAVMLFTGVTFGFGIVFFPLVIAFVVFSLFRVVELVASSIRFFRFR